MSSTTLGPPPKPVFVICDTLSQSYSSALSVCKTRKLYSENELEPILICGTNDGMVVIWSLVTFKCCGRFKLVDEHQRLLKEADTCTNGGDVHIKFIWTSPSTGNLLVQLHSLVPRVLLLDECDYSMNSHLIPANLSTKKSWLMNELTYSRCVPLFGDFFAFLAPTKVTNVTYRLVELVNAAQCTSVAIVQLDGAGGEPKTEMKPATKDREASVKRAIDDYGIVMDMHCFLLDQSLPQDTVKNEQLDTNQALYIVLAYETGHLSLFRSPIFGKLDQSRPFISLSASQLERMQMHTEMIVASDLYHDTATHSIRGITCSVDQEISLWELVNLPDQRPVITENLKTAEVNQYIYEHKRRRIKLPKNNNAHISCCAIRPDGRIFATGDQAGRIRVYALRSGKPLAVLSYHSVPINRICFTNNLCDMEKNYNDQSIKSNYLLVASAQDRTISLWSLYNNLQQC